MNHSVASALGDFETQNIEDPRALFEANANLPTLIGMKIMSSSFHCGQVLQMGVGVQPFETHVAARAAAGRGDDAATGARAAVVRHGGRAPAGIPGARPRCDPLCHSCPGPGAHPRGGCGRPADAALRITDGASLPGRGPKGGRRAVEGLAFDALRPAASLEVATRLRGRPSGFSKSGPLRRAEAVSNRCENSPESYASIKITSSFSSLSALTNAVSELVH